MFVSTTLLALIAPLAIARPITAPSTLGLIVQGGSCLGVNAPRGPAQMLRCTALENVQWEATVVPDSASYKLKNVMFGCYAARKENASPLFCDGEDRASAFTFEQVTDDESMIVHGGQMDRVALHVTPGTEGARVYFASHTPDTSSLFLFVSVFD